MTSKPKSAITPTRTQNYSDWYLQVIAAADLAEHSSVRGCMIIKPWGYALWENMQQILDGMFKETGHVNAYFPLLIPLKNLQKEAEHIEGFAKECAVVTHHRLEADAEGNLQPAGPLEEPYVIRPTSETIIAESYAKWIQSYRDLPLLINQWANVMRWEMRTRLFLRTSEFLWQEGHTAHATADEAIAETKQMLDIYATFVERDLAIPVIRGEKTADERFPGAVDTYCIEAMMQDRKAIQAGTSHFLGQNFAKAADITFSDKDSTQQHAWTTSWGCSTRLVGGLIMTHSDDNGLVLPPRVAPKHIVIVPIYRNDEERETVMAYVADLEQALKAQRYADQPLRVMVDDRDMNAGAKAWYHVKRGVPLRVEVGPRDIAKDQVCVVRRDQCTQKDFLLKTVFVDQAKDMLEALQGELFKRAEDYLTEYSAHFNSADRFEAFFTAPKQASGKGGKKSDNEQAFYGGFAYAHVEMTPEVIERLKSFKVTARCIPLKTQETLGPCIFTGKADQPLIVFARAY